VLISRRTCRVGADRTQTTIEGRLYRALRKLRDELG